MLNTREIHTRLVSTRNRIEKHGLTKGLNFEMDAEFSLDKPGCLVQHINRSAEFDYEGSTHAEQEQFRSDNTQVQYFVAKFLPAGFKSCCGMHVVACWNDHFATLDQVYELLDRAIQATALTPDVSFLDASYVEEQREDSTLLPA